MSRMIRQSPALIVAVVALIVALSGTAIASGLITGKQIKNSSITGIDVKNKSLTSADFRGSVTGPAGARGATGPQGAPGPQGPPGLAQVTDVDGPTQSFPSGSYGGAPNAQCPAGMVVVGTGFNGPFGRTGGFVKAYGTFVGGFFANESSITVTGQVQAVCARQTTAAAARAMTGTARTAARRQFQRDVAVAKELLRRRGGATH